MSPPNERRSGADGSLPLPAVSGSDCVAPPIGELAACFTRWFERHDGQESFWPAFDRWIRDALNQFISARRVRCFRLTGPDRRLTPLASKFDETRPGDLSPGTLIDHVVAAGRRYLRDAPGNGELVEQLARNWPAATDTAGKGSIFCRPPDWVVPVRNKNKTIGLLIVGELPPETRDDLAIVQAVGNLLELFWLHVEQAEALAIARRTDRASGVLNRIDLASLAEKVLQESANEGEPLVVVALSVEGVRRLDDTGQWELRDWLMKQIGLEMRRKLRSDDLIGRFSDDRFVVVLRRLDISLGQIIARKLLDAVEDRASRQAFIQQAIAFRCGLADGVGYACEPSAESSPPTAAQAKLAPEGFEAVLGRAFEALRRARDQQQAITLAPRAELQTACANVETGP